MTQAPDPPAPAIGRPYAALVLAGGGARRLGGVDKPGVTVGGRTLLDRVLAACADAAATVVVGPRRPTYRPVRWAREEPPGGGPLAALQAGLDALEGSAQDPVLVVSADLPFLSPEAVRALVAVPERYDGAIVHDGRDQPLPAAYRVEPLRRELALLRTEYGSVASLPLRMVLQGLMLHRVTSPSVTAAALDCDTWDDIATARARIREHEAVLDEWIAAVKAELGVELDVDTSALLDLARDAAHGVARPAAPLTTFLVGYAAARADGSPQDVARAAETAARLARRWADETADPAGDTDMPGNAPGNPSGNTDAPGNTPGNSPENTDDR
ncbi:NTP transferase domain-containing protein [Streptomyces sp. CA-250714]|uniref:NTP transferase domain-containing protein n=1 Tax=Streptomyces sp. CA-250714 TaxID=3240060 RepID=UPI003D941053